MYLRYNSLLQWYLQEVKMKDKLLWNIRLWSIGIGAIIFLPVVVAWFLLVNLPIKIGEKLNGCL
jgi:hypothetical protein